MFNILGSRDKNENKLKDFYESCLQKISLYNVNCIAFCCIRIDIPGCDPRKAAEMV